MYDILDLISCKQKIYEVMCRQNRWKNWAKLSIMKKYTSHLPYAPLQPEPDFLTCKQMLIVNFVYDVIHLSEIINRQNFQLFSFLYIHFIIDKAFKIMIMLIFKDFFLKLINQSICSFNCN